MTGPFTVCKHDDGDGVARIMVSGEIDHDVGEALSLILINAAEQTGVRHVVVDLAAVPFLGAAGVRCLLTGRQVALRHGRALSVANAEGIVRDTLRAAGVAGILSVEKGAVSA
ncbi:STAS domain-containing protein [Actinoplanes xinjiangensis]|uniref:STAS domain-containing protein n=1 Tax=Actinoplanes xinjiangensis TaxID=512350 RepID=UPI003416FC6C